MLDKIRTSLHQVIEPRGDGPLALPRMFARRLNGLLGSPLCSAEELEKRRAARRRLGELTGSAQTKLAREVAPVVVYLERDRNQRLIDRVEELLKARGIPYRSLDVTGDEATMSFITREAKCKEDDLPIVYVAGTPIGGYNDLVEWDVSGRLKTAVFGG
jgi:glutaredoxin